MDEQGYLRQLADEAYDTVDMLSSHRKGERERRAAAAFLRWLGVHFSPAELVSPESDPPDVVFREARFEVMILLDEGRQMHADWEKMANQRDSAQSLDDLTVPYQPSVPTPFREVISLAIAALGQKATHYGPKTCSDLDALVYINFMGRHLYPLAKVHVPEELQAQDWRSVCFLFAPYSHVLYVTPEAPAFLRQQEGGARQECQDPDVMFDL